MSRTIEEDKIRLIKALKAIEGIEPDRLEAICNAERDGRCLVLPCKVGNRIHSNKGQPMNLNPKGDRITQIILTRGGVHFKTWWGYFHISDIGKNVFIGENAESEAKAKLDELNKGEK